MLNGSNVIAVGDQYQATIHDFNRERAANIKPGSLKLLAFQVDRRRGGGLVVLRHVFHGVITFVLRGFIYRPVLLRMRLNHYSTPR
ncbi:hypothetical protein ABLB69_19555 [Xenorhabdus khoisanae]|uniref:hypothetical protein n=1 Tax=Xenorhabdus khoisanae TaxID=880157 RepID=UPI0013792B9C|nr:hypothetical protein [Xenorhabdus khoisanae]